MDGGGGTRLIAVHPEHVSGREAQRPQAPAQVAAGLGQTPTLPNTRSPDQVGRQGGCEKGSWACPSRFKPSPPVQDRQACASHRTSPVRLPACQSPINGRGWSLCLLRGGGAGYRDQGRDEGGKLIGMARLAARPAGHNGPLIGEAVINLLGGSGFCASGRISCR